MGIYPVERYYLNRRRRAGVILGYATVDPAVISGAVKKWRRAYDAVSRK